MNKIYKVVWSKVKNCYVVVSEIAKNVISGSVKSAKVGCVPVTKGFALGALMAFVITGNAWATANSIEVGQGETYKFDNATITITDVADNERPFAVRASNENSMISGNNLTVTITGGEWASGVEATRSANVTLEKAELTVTNDNVEGSETYGINVARQGTAIVNNELIATITGGEWASGVEAYNGSGINVGDSTSNVNLTVTANSQNVTDADGEEWGVRAHGVFAAGQTLDVYDENGDLEEKAYGGSTINIDATGLTVNTTADYGQAYGIYAEDDSYVKVTGAVNITATGYSAYGVEALNSSTVELGSVGKNVSISAISTGDGENAESIAVYAGDDSKVDITARKVVVKATSGNENQPGSSLQVKSGGEINIVANNVNVTGLVYAEGTEAKVNVTANKQAKITSDIYAYAGGSVSMNLNTENASFTGATYTEENGKGIGLNLTQGAIWYVTDNSTVSSVVGDEFYINKADEQKEVTVIIDGSIPDGMDTNYESTAVHIDGVELVIRERDESGLGGNVTINSTSNVTVEGAQHGIHTVRSNNTNVTAGSVVLINGSGYDAIRAESGGAVNVNAGSINVNGSMQAEGDNSRINIQANTNANITSDIYVNDGGGVRMILATEDSIFTGSTKVDNNDGAIVFRLCDGATWKVTENSNISKLSGNNLNVVAAEGAENVKVTIDGDNHNKEELYEDVYDKAGLPEYSSSILNLTNVDLAIIDEEGGGLEACGQGSNNIINSNSNFEGFFGEVGIEVEGAGVVSVTAKDVTFTTGEDTIYVYDEVVEESNSIGDAVVENGNVATTKGIVVLDASGNINLTSTGELVLNNDSTQSSEIKLTGTNINLTSDNGAAVAVGHDVRDSSYNGIVTVGNEKTAIVTITGATQDLREVYDEEDNLINYNEDNRAIVFAQGDVNIIATEKVEINDTTENKKAVAAYGGANVIIDGGKKTVLNGEINADGHKYAVQSDDRIEHQDNDRADDINILIKGKEIIVDADLYAGEGVFARGDSSGADNAIITIGDENTEKVCITDVDSGLVASNGGSKVVVNSDALIISADGKLDDEAIGIHVENSSNTYNKLASVDVNANQTKIVVEDELFALGVCANGKTDVDIAGDVEIVANIASVNGTSANGQAFGIYAQDKGDVKATGAINITATGYSAYGVEVLNSSTVEIGSSDKDVIFTITSNGVDSNLEDDEYPEAQAISAEGSSKVIINAKNIAITTTATSDVTGSLQARDNGSEITVKATDVDVTGDIFAGEGAKVTVNTTGFVVDGRVGSAGVVDITTGDVAYDEKTTQFYTEDNGVINFAGGNITGTLNIVKGNVNLTGATFTANDINNAITGNGKLVVDGSGVLKTTADQVFTVGGKDTVTTNEKVLANNAITAIAQEKVTFKAGSLSLDDDYSYEYLTSINDVLKSFKYDGSNESGTKIVMTGKLIAGNGEDGETKPGQSITTDDLNKDDNFDNQIEMDNVTVEADKNLLIGANVAEDGSVEIATGDDSPIKVEDSVENGFSANQLDLGEGSTGAVITGGQEIVLGGSQNDTSKGAHEVVTVDGKKQEVIIVVGTEHEVAGVKDTKGTLKIGNSAAKETDKYQLTGKAVINKDSELHTKGETTITKGVELKDGGKVHVDKDAHLKANIKAKGIDNVITGKVTGNLEVDEAHTSTVIHLGNDKKAGKMNAEHSNLKGGTLFLDPAYAKGIDEGSAFALANASVLDGAYIAGQNSTISFGVNSTDVAEDVFAKTGLTFGGGKDSNGNPVEADVNAVVYITSTTDVAAGSITADGTMTNASPVGAGVVRFANNSLLMVEAEDVNGNTAAITGASDVTVDANAKLYIDDAIKGATYRIIDGKDDSWKVENILTNNQLIKFTDANTNANDGKLELVASVKTVNEVYGKDVIIDKVVDEALDKGANPSDSFNSAVDNKFNANTVAQVDALNSIGAMNEVAGVTHTTYAVSNILTDAVVDHMSLANGKEHDKDVWARYVHTKEDVDGLKYDAHSTQYSAQYNGIVVGSDLYKEGKATVGAALTYVDGNINGSSVAARTENDAKYYGASVYGSICNNDTTVIADASYLHSEHDITQRNSGKVITGEPESDAFSVGVRVEKEAKAGIGKLVPYAGLRYMHLGTGNYTNSIGLAYDADDAELFLLPVGLKYTADIKNNNGWTMRPVVEFGYVWAFGDTDANQTVSLNGASNSFGYDVTDSGSYVGRFMLEAEKANISYALGYEYQKGDDVKADKWMFNVNWKF